MITISLMAMCSEDNLDTFLQVAPSGAIFRVLANLCHLYYLCSWNSGINLAPKNEKAEISTDF